MEGKYRQLRVSKKNRHVKLKFDKHAQPFLFSEPAVVENNNESCADCVQSMFERFYEKDDLLPKPKRR